MKEGLAYIITAAALAVDAAVIGIFLIKALQVPGNKKLLRRYQGRKEKDKTKTVAIFIGIFVIVINLLIFVC